MNKLMALVLVVVACAAIFWGLRKCSGLWSGDGEWESRPVTLSIPTKSVALVVQNHVPGGTPVSLAAFASTLTANLAGSDFRIINKDNVIGVNQNRTVEGEVAVSPESSVTSIGQMLNAAGVLTASVVEFTSTSLGVPTPHSYKLSARVALSLADSASGAAVCSFDKAKEDIFTKEQMEADGSVLYERLLLGASVECAKYFLEKLKDADWQPTPPELAKVKFLCNISGASVKLDGIVVGTAPVCVIAPRGVHNLCVERQFYVPYKNKVNLMDGLRLEIPLHLDEEGQKRFGASAVDAANPPEQSAQGAGTSQPETPAPTASWWGRIVEWVKGMF